MAYPNADWPTSKDSAADRVDAVDIVYADEFNYLHNIFERIEDWLGLTGEIVGGGVAGSGPGGWVSPKADGSVAHTLAARSTFTSGKLVSITDDYGGADTEKARVDHDGKIWTAAGIDLSSGVLNPPIGGTLPVAGMVQGDLFYKTGVNEGLYNYSSSGWALAGGGIGAGSYKELSVNFTYSQLGTPIEEVSGIGTFDGGLVGPGACYFTVSLNTVFTAAGQADIKLWELGPRGGPYIAPRLVATLSTTIDGGPQDIEQLLGIEAAPVGNEIHDSARTYEVTVVQSSTVGDSVYIGSCGLEVR